MMNLLQALSQFGENYELMSYVLPGRDRKACKAKFKTEDKKNSQRINHCLKNRIPYGESQLLCACVIGAKPAFRHADTLQDDWKRLLWASSGHTCKISAEPRTFKS